MLRQKMKEYSVEIRRQAREDALKAKREVPRGDQCLAQLEALTKNEQKFCLLNNYIQKILALEGDDIKLVLLYNLSLPIEDEECQRRQCEMIRFVELQIQTQNLDLVDDTLDVLYNLSLNSKCQFDEGFISQLLELLHLQVEDMNLDKLLCSILNIQQRVRQQIAIDQLLIEDFYFYSSGKYVTRFFLFLSNTSNATNAAMLYGDRSFMLHLYACFCRFGYREKIYALYLVQQIIQDIEKFELDLDLKLLLEEARQFPDTTVSHLAADIETVARMRNEEA